MPRCLDLQVSSVLIPGNDSRLVEVRNEQSPGLHTQRMGNYSYMIEGTFKILKGCNNRYHTRNGKGCT